MKKLLSLLLCVVMMLFTFAGCNKKSEPVKPSSESKNVEEKVPEKSVPEVEKEEKEVSVQDIIAAVSEKVASVECFHLEAEVESRMISGDIEISSDTEITSEVNFNDKIQYTSMKQSSANGETYAETYIKENGDSTDVYVLSNGEWMKQTGIPSAKAEELRLKTATSDKLLLYIEAIRDSCTMEEDIVQETDCYVFIGEINTKNEEILEETGLGNVISMLLQNNLSEEQINNIISNAGKFLVLVAVDKESLLPIKIEVDLTNVTQKILDGLQEALGESAMLKVEKNVTVTNYSKYNEMDVIVIPDEAKNAPETVIY